MWFCLILYDSVWFCMIGWFWFVSQKLLFLRFFRHGWIFFTIHIPVVSLERGGVINCTPRVPKLRIWLLRCWGRCLKVRVSRAQTRKWGPPSAWAEFGIIPLTLTLATVTKIPEGRKRGVFWKVVIRFWNFGYDFWGVEGYIWRWLCRKISTHVDWGPSGGSSVRKPGSEDPHRRERKFFHSFYNDFLLDTCGAHSLGSPEN